MYPTEDILIERGKYSTLSKERKEQIKRVQGVCTTMIASASQIMNDCQAKPPTNMAAYESMAKCLENAISARDRIAALCTEMSAIEPKAWGEG